MLKLESRAGGRHGRGRSHSSWSAFHLSELCVLPAKGTQYYIPAESIIPQFSSMGTSITQCPIGRTSPDPKNHHDGGKPAQSKMNSVSLLAKSKSVLFAFFIPPSSYRRPLCLATPNMGCRPRTRCLTNAWRTINGPSDAPRAHRAPRSRHSTPPRWLVALRAWRPRRGAAYLPDS